MLNLKTLSVSLAIIGLVGVPLAVQARDKHQQPFASNSIWNTPIGSNAKLIDISIGSKGVGIDTDWYIQTKDSDPAVSTYMIPTWGQGRCTGTIPQQQGQWHPAANEKIKIPHDFIIPDARPGFTPNNSSSFLKPDGKTLVEFNATTRCQPGAPLYGNWFGEHSIYGDGIKGGHGGSGMSSIGGSVRTGELFGDKPIPHALKVVLWGEWLNYNANSATPGKRWPAELADANARNAYHGKYPSLVMGSLLTIPTWVNTGNLGITTPEGKKIFKAMQDYGAYVVDDSGWDYSYLAVEKGAEVEYQKVKGVHFNDDKALQADLTKIFQALDVVDNNSPTSIGGGGIPRAPLAPPISN